MSVKSFREEPKLRSKILQTNRSLFNRQGWVSPCAWPSATAGQIGTIRSAISRVERRWATITREIGRRRMASLDRPLVLPRRDGWLPHQAAGCAARDRARAPTRCAASARQRASCPYHHQGLVAHRHVHDLAVYGGTNLATCWISSGSDEGLKLAMFSAIEPANSGRPAARSQSGRGSLEPDRL